MSSARLLRYTTVTTPARNVALLASDTLLTLGGGVTGVPSQYRTTFQQAALADANNLNPATDFLRTPHADEREPTAKETRRSIVHRRVTHSAE